MPTESGDQTVDELTTDPLPVETGESENDREEGAEEQDQEATPPAGDDDSDEEETKEAKNLYKLLKDPKTSAGTIRLLAKNAGVLQEAPTTKKEETQQRKAVAQILKEELGEYAFLADKLGPAIDKVLAQSQRDIEDKINATEAARIKTDIVRIGQKLNRETRGDFDKHEVAMTQLSKEMPYMGNISHEQYMRNLYTLATNGKKVDPGKLQERINRNQTNASDRVRSTSGRDQVVIDPNKVRSLKEAVRLAADNIEAKGKNNK